MSRALAVLAVVLALSCGGAAPVSAPSPSPSPSPAPSVAASRSPAPSAPSGPAAASDTTRVEGTVASTSSTKLTLADNTAVDLLPSTRIVRTDRATLADLRPGVFVAITAKQQPDSTLLASIVNIFPASLSATIPAGQRPLPQGDLMTNAPIASVDQVSGSSFTVTFPGGGAKVLLAPGVVLTKQSDVKPEDIAMGTKIVATIRNGAAQSIQIPGQ